MGRQIRKVSGGGRYPFILVKGRKALFAVVLLAILVVSSAAAGEAAGHLKAALKAPGDTAEPRIGDAGETEFDAFDEFESAAPPEVYDPLIGYNRIMTRVNDRLYFWVLKPAAQAYGAVLPKFARQCISRFFGNLGYPIRLVNNLLQFKIKGAGVETLRFGMNSTLGIAGFMDPAEEGFQLAPSDEDFGQTLGYYGVNGGFHLVLPVFGPSNFRDTLGRFPDNYLDPLNYIRNTYVNAGVPVLEVINGTSLRIGHYESFRKDAMDMYILFRNGYTQNRKKEIEE